MIRIKKHGEILKPTQYDFENKSVFNPGVYQEGNKVHIIYRALDKNLASTFGYAELEGPTTVVKRWKRPFLKAKFKYESMGIEDPRITKINDTYYVVYVAHNGRDAVIAYMQGKSLFKLRRNGIISPRLPYRDAGQLFMESRLKDQYCAFASYYEKYGHKNILVWEKDGVLFPEKIRGKYALLHRILPDIQMIRFNDFSELKKDITWQKHIKELSKHVVLEGWHGWEARHIGAGAPPIKTKKGWLLIYHGVEPRNKGRVYYAGAALLDLKDPTRVIARLPYPLIRPDMRHERQGHVHDVVFPTGTAQFNERLFIYYGSADSYVSAASVNLEMLIKELLKNKLKT